MCLEERNDSDISSDSCELVFEVRLGLDFSKSDLEERLDINMGCCAPEVDSSSEPDLEMSNMIKMMMKLQKRNINKEFEPVLFTNSKTKSIIFAIRKRE